MLTKNLRLPSFASLGVVLKTFQVVKKKKKTSFFVIIIFFFILLYLSLYLFLFFPVKNPFEGIDKEFCKPIEPDLRKQLDDSLKRTAVDQFVAQLFEYIILDLKGSTNEDQDIIEWR